ncbi:MAG: 6-phosphofructokinase [Acidobacteria bacterium]|nr:6-phosphofructokinase [Acidobacteriota bacterium]
MATKRKIGILTGGGDVPGLNSVIKGVTYRATEVNMEVLGFRRGWEGLTHLNLEDEASKSNYLLPLDRTNTRRIDRDGGTMLHSSRTNPAKMRKVASFLNAENFPSQQITKKGETFTAYDVSKHVIKNLETLGVDTLVAIGGDDTLSYAQKLHAQGFKVVCVPKTMDNDVRNTEYCIGFSTAIGRAHDAIQRQRTTVGSHERVGVFRIFGRDAGYTALYTAYVTSIRCGIPEHKFNAGKMIELLAADKKNNPSKYALVVLSEGAEWEGYKVVEYGEMDDYGHKKKMNVGEAFADELRKNAKLESIVSDLTYDLRGGSPDFTDKVVATTFGNMAFDAILEGKSGLMAAINNGRYAMVEIPDPALGPRHVDVDTMYNVERYRPSYHNKAGMPIFLANA